MGRLSSERAVVQSPLVRYATEAGWTYIDPDEALRSRRGETNSIFWDTFGRRIYKSSPAGTYIYVYDGPNVIQELGNSGNLLASYTQGLGTDEPLALYQGAGTSYFHADGLGSVASLTDPTGAVAVGYVYDSFGNLTASTGTVTNPFQYTGREFDSETSIYYYRARYYEPISGRFLSEDPAGMIGGINFYRYVSNSPLNDIDPSGLWSPKAHDQMLWNALHGCSEISDADIYQMQRGSRYVDENFQGPEYSFMHAMSNGNANQSALAAETQTAAFITAESRAVQTEVASGYWNQAIFEFGIAMHPVMDMTSPAHTDVNGNPIPWCGMGGCGGVAGLEQVAQHSVADVTGIERVQDLNAHPEMQQRENIMIRNYFQAATGKTLNCPCQK